MPVSSGEILCRRCAVRELPEPELLRYLDEYVSSLPETMRVCDATYARRLAECACCAHRARYTCTLCGCYVQARAAKRTMACPIPGAPRWEREKDEEAQFETAAARSGAEGHASGVF